MPRFGRTNDGLLGPRDFCLREAPSRRRTNRPLKPGRVGRRSVESMQAYALWVVPPPVCVELSPRGTSIRVQARAQADAAMERYSRGDDSAFALVYDALAPRLYPFLLRQTRDRGGAEDLLQQTMLHIHRARDRFIPGAEVTPWAFAIARRLLVDGLRRGRRELLTDDGEPSAHASGEPGAEDLVHARELAERVEGALAKLPQSQRVAFELIKQEGLTVAEAAQVLGTTVAAVKLRAHRAYEALRVALGDVLARLEEKKS